VLKIGIIYETLLLTDHEFSKYSRQFAVARIQSLVTLDAAGISPKERIDCELFYLSYIVQHGPKGEEERCREHPRWPDLCAKHGRPDEARNGKGCQDKLSNRIIQLNIYKYPGPSAFSSPLMVLRVLPTMTLQTFRLKIWKAVKSNFHSAQQPVALWLKMADGTLAQLSGDQDKKDLAWLGFDNDSDVIFNMDQM